jgi:outer membrane protein TolC
MPLKLRIVALCFLSPGFAAAVPPGVQKMFDRLDEENPEIYAAKLDTQYKFQSLRGSRSRLYPSLSLSGVARESSESAFSDPASLNTGISSPSGSLGNQGTSSISNLNESAGSGWSGQTSVSYLVFTGYAVTEDIRRAENDFNASKISYEVMKEQKRSQFLSLLLEWQNLKTIEPVIDQAVSLSEGVKSYKSKRSAFLYTTSDKVDFAEKLASLEYNQVRVKEGLQLVEAALVKMLPLEITKVRLSTTGLRRQYC